MGGDKVPPPLCAEGAAAAWNPGFRPDYHFLQGNMPFFVPAVDDRDAPGTGLVGVVPRAVQ